MNERGVASFESKDPAADSRRLLRRFLERAYRRPVPDGDVERFGKLADKALAAGFSFTDAMISTYSAVLCSPAFVTLEEKPGRLDSFALASRLSYFLWNSEPDATLRQLAEHNQLQNPSVLRAQTQRMLGDASSQRFVQAFLDYWLDLRKLNNTSPDASLYPDYYLDDFLVESAGDAKRRAPSLRSCVARTCPPAMWSPPILPCSTSDWRRNTVSPVSRARLCDALLCRPIRRAAACSRRPVS